MQLYWSWRTLWIQFCMLTTFLVVSDFVVFQCNSLGCDEQNNGQGGQGDRCLRKLKQSFLQIITINVLSVKIYILQVGFGVNRVSAELYSSHCVYNRICIRLSLVYVGSTDGNWSTLAELSHPIWFHSFGYNSSLFFWTWAASSDLVSGFFEQLMYEDPHSRIHSHNFKGISALIPNELEECMSSRGGTFHFCHNVIYHDSA